MTSHVVTHVWVVDRGKAITIGGGVSRGNYSSNILNCVDNWDPYCDWTGTINWANAELGLEGQTDKGFTWRVFGGVGVPLNPNALQCGPDNPAAGESCEPATRPRVGVVPSVGCALGYSF
jgi:hypothetical protein